MKRLLLTLSLLPILAVAQSSYDGQNPMGMATVTSRTNTGTNYNVTGGGCHTYPISGVQSSQVIVLSSNGKDMANTIKNAITNYKVVVFDGQDGDFIVSSIISLSNLSGKTLIGINGARLCTKWYVTAADKAALDAVSFTDKSGNTRVGVKNASTNASDGLGGTVNGNYISEQREFLTRKTLYARYGNENYQNAGIFGFGSCSNIIIRNLKFVGPGPVDVGGKDLISFNRCTHMWVDHCDFTDGIDGNFDITQGSDYNTVSWCTFSYTERAYDHMNSNLVGSSDSDSPGLLNTTYAFCHWGDGCKQRMPMARSGKIHILSCYYTCAGNSASVNPRANSEFLIEESYFGAGVNNIFSQSGATAYVWSTTNIVTEKNAKGQIPSNRGTVSMPYSYTSVPAASVPTEVGRWAGATLFGATPKPETETLCINLTTYPSLPAEWSCASLTLDTVKSQAGFNSPNTGFNMNSNSNYIALDLSGCADLYIAKVSFDITIPGYTTTKNTFEVTMGDDAQSQTVGSASTEKRTYIGNENIQMVKIRRTAGTRTVINNLCYEIAEKGDPTGVETQREANRSYRYLRNGHLYIYTHGRTYDIQGRPY